MVRIIILIPILLMVFNVNAESLYINFIGIASAWMFYLWTKNTKSGKSYLFKMMKGVCRFNAKVESLGSKK